MLKHLVLLGCLAISSFTFAQGGGQQIILLKLDDVVARRVGTKPVSDRWLKVADYLKTNNIKGSFGIITESLEKDNPMYFQWLKDMQKEGLIEFWMHGYHMKTATEPGEFEQGTAAEQQAILEKGMKLAQEKLGFPLPAFRPTLERNHRCHGRGFTGRAGDQDLALRSKEAEVLHPPEH